LRPERTKAFTKCDSKGDGKKKNASTTDDTRTGNKNHRVLPYEKMGEPDTIVGRLKNIKEGELWLNSNNPQVLRLFTNYDRIDIDRWQQDAYKNLSELADSTYWALRRYKPTDYRDSYINEIGRPDTFLTIDDEKANLTLMCEFKHKVAEFERKFKSFLSSISEAEEV